MLFQVVRARDLPEFKMDCLPTDTGAISTSIPPPNMQPTALDSMSLKIHSFLRNAGINSSPKGDVAQLVAYFEREYGLNVMSFLESEWLNEQLERDMSSGDLSDLRSLVSDNQKESFDEDVAALWA